MEINIFLLCYNEASLLPHTINHYRKYLPSCKITIYDNESTDNSVEIAKSQGCDVVSWSSGNIHNEHMLIFLRNTIWKNILNGWIIIADMDEYICVTETELLEEFNSGTSILQIEGINMIGESNNLDLTDIDLQQIQKYVEYSNESKNLCFLREKITEMNYGPGSHYCKPIGEIKYSLKKYINKHMSNLGLKYIINKMTRGYQRNEEMRKIGWNGHYTDNNEIVTKSYMNLLTNCKNLDDLHDLDDI
jgi:hypothetical protein